MLPNLLSSHAVSPSSIEIHFIGKGDGYYLKDSLVSERNFCLSIRVVVESSSKKLDTT